MNPTELRAFLARLATLALFVLGLYAAYLARDIVTSVILAGIFVAVVSPILSRAEKRGIPTLVGLLGLYFAMLCLGILLLVAVVPLISREFVGFAHVLRDWGQSVAGGFASGDVSSIPGVSYLNSRGFDIDRDFVENIVRTHAKEALSWLSDNFAAIASGFGTGVLGVFGTISTIAFTLVLAFFLGLERREVYAFVSSLLPDLWRKRLESATPAADRIFLTWLRGQAILCTAVFLATYLGLLILGVVFGIQLRGQFSLAVIAGLCEFVPIIGPLLAAIPAVIIAVSGGPIAIGAVAVLYFLIQELENLFLVPRIQGSALELSTFTVLVGMALAGSLFGIVGVLFTLPMLALLKSVMLASRKIPEEAVPKPNKIKK